MRSGFDRLSAAEPIGSRPASRRSSTRSGLPEATPAVSIVPTSLAGPFRGVKRSIAFTSVGSFAMRALTFSRSPALAAAIAPSSTARRAAAAFCFSTQPHPARDAAKARTRRIRAVLFMKTTESREKRALGKGRRIPGNETAGRGES
jgi:hypothetical protein